MLTNTQIKNKLIAANYIGEKKVNSYIENLKNGNFCPELLTEANILFGLIDSIRCYKIYDNTEESLSYTTIQIDSFSDVADMPYVISIDKCVLASGTYTGNFQDFTGSGYLGAYGGLVGDVLTALGIEYNIQKDAEGAWVRFFPINLPCWYTTSTPTEFGIYLGGDLLPSVLATGDIAGGVCNYPYQDCITYEQLLNILSAIKKIV